MNITQHLTEVEERYAQRAKELIQNTGDKTIVLFMQYFITESKKFIVEEITNALEVQAEELYRKIVHCETERTIIHPEGTFNQGRAKALSIIKEYK